MTRSKYFIYCVIITFFLLFVFLGNGNMMNECIYKRMQIHQQTGIPMSSKDKSDYGKKIQANRRSGKAIIFFALLIIIQ